MASIMKNSITDSVMDIHEAIGKKEGFIKLDKECERIDFLFEDFIELCFLIGFVPPTDKTSEFKTIQAKNVYNKDVEFIFLVAISYAKSDKDFPFKSALVDSNMNIITGTLLDNDNKTTLTSHKTFKEVFQRFNQFRYYPNY